MYKFIKSTSLIAYMMIALIVGALCGYFYTLLRPDFPIFGGVIAFYMVMLALILRIAVTGQRRTRRRFSYLIIPLVMLTFWGTMHAMFDDFNVQAIIYHAIYGFTSNGVPSGYLEVGLFILIGLLIIGLAFTVTVVQSKIFARIDAFAVVPLILLNPLVIETAQGLGIGGENKQLLTAHYKHLATVKSSQPSRPNIIHIFLESAERTLADEEQFGPSMRPVMSFENRGISLTNIQQIKNTEWTMAGMVAANCGVPLMQPWLVASRNKKATEGRFLPNVRCLGEVLAGVGYNARYIMGAQIGFAGTGNFYRDHGFAKAEGFDELIGEYRSHLADWGLADTAVYEHAERTIRELSTREQPFIVTMASIGGHGPAGYAAPACLNGDIDIKSTRPIAIGVECANALTKNMLINLENDGLLENTIVIIQNDHLLMGSEFAPALNKMDRRDLFIAFGPGIEKRKIDRPAAMIDVYPTILEMLGYELPDHRAGLGTSLLSERPTLLEELGAETLNSAILYDAKLRRMMWIGKGIDGEVSTASTDE